MRRLYLALFLTLTAPAPFAADLERAKEIADNKCQHCHGRDDEGSSAIYPRLAAQHEEYIAKQLADFKSLVGKHSRSIVRE